MKLKLFLISSAVFVGCNSKSANSKVEVKDSVQQEQNCAIIDLIEHVSFQYRYSDLFKTGKIINVSSNLSSDTTITYGGKSLRFKTNYFEVENRNLKIGSTSNIKPSALLIVLDGKMYLFQFKKNGMFEFIGYKTDGYFFRFSSSDCKLYFSLGFKKPEVDLIEYTVKSD